MKRATDREALMEEPNQLAAVVEKELITVLRL